MTRPEESDKKSSDLNYGEGQREQYGEGYRNRPEDLSDGADKSTDHEWAGGDRDKQKAETDRPPGEKTGRKTSEP